MVRTRTGVAQKRKCRVKCEKGRLLLSFEGDDKQTNNAIKKGGLVERGQILIADTTQGYMGKEVAELKIEKTPMRQTPTANTRKYNTRSFPFVVIFLYFNGNGLKSRDEVELMAIGGSGGEWGRCQRGRAVCGRGACTRTTSMLTRKCSFT